MKDQQSYTSVFVVYLTIQVAARSTSPDVTTLFHAIVNFWRYKATLGETNFIESIKAPTFLEAVLAIDIIEIM